MLLPACGPTKFTAAERAELSSVSIAETTVDPEAHEEPYGGDVEAKKLASAVSTGGVLGPLIGAGVGSAIAGTQNANFKGNHSGHFPAVMKNTPKDVGALLSAELRKELKSDLFFKNRLREKSSNVVTSEIALHRLIRVGKNDNGNLLFSPEVHAKIELKNAAQKHFAGGIYVGTGTGGHTIQEYAADPAISRRAYESAIDAAVNTFMAGLASRTQE